MTILNRPIMILKGEFGFLGLKNNKIEANRPIYDAFELDQADNGLYTFKGQHLILSLLLTVLTSQAVAGEDSLIMAMNINVIQRFDCRFID